jgi:hypothetical protein
MANGGSARKWLNLALNRAPDDPDRARDPVSVEREAVMVGEVQQRGQAGTGGDAPDLVGEQVGRNVLVAGRDVRGRPPAPLDEATIASACGAAAVARSRTSVK